MHTLERSKQILSFLRAVGMLLIYLLSEELQEGLQGDFVMLSLAILILELVLLNR